MSSILHWPQLAGLLLCLLLAVSPVLPLDAMRLVLLLALLAGEVWFSRQAARPPGPALAGTLRACLIWLPWLVWGLLSWWWSQQPHYTWYYWLNEMLFAVMLFVLGVRLAARPVADGWIFSGLTLMALVLALLSGAHLLWPEQVPLYLPGWLDNEPQATVYLVLAQVAALWWMIKGGRRGWAVGMVTLLAVLLMAWVAGKRAPYLALLALCVLPLPLLWRAGLPAALLRRLALVLAVFGALGALAAWQLVSTRPASYLAGVGLTAPGLHSTVANSDRYDIWRFWLEEGQASPWLGTGAGRFLPQHVYAHTIPKGVDPWSRAHAHNAWLNQWLQLGVPGVIFFSLIWISLAIRFWPVRSDENCQYVNILRALAFSALAAMVIRNSTDDLLFGSSGAVWWLVIAFLYYRAQISVTAKRQPI